MKKKCKLTNQLSNKVMIVLKKLLSMKLDWLKKIKDISYWNFIIGYFIFFCVGRVLLFFNPIRYDWIHQIVLTVISFIVIYALKYIYDMTQEIKKASFGLTYKNRKKIFKLSTMSTIIDQMIDMQNSIWWPIIMLFPAIGFVRKNLYLGFVEKNPAGYYAVIFGALTFYIALLGYSQILVALIHFYKIAHDKDSCISVDYPSDMVAPPTWFSLWRQLFQKIVMLFFVAGTLFTLEYILLMPPDVVVIKDKTFIFNVCDVNKFILSWLTIFIWIIIAFPLISIIINNMQKLLIKNLNKKINYEHTILLNTSMESKSVLDLWMYRQLMETPIKYTNYSQIYKKIIPLISTIISLLLNIIKLYESIIL